MKNKFKVGDRVRSKIKAFVVNVGDVGTVKFVHDGQPGGYQITGGYDVLFDGQSSDVYMNEPSLDFSLVTFSDDFYKSLTKDTKSLLPSDAKTRKEIPIGTGVLDYFPAALAEVARVSYEGNKQHNPGQPLHWARGKSGDQADTMIRHYLERGTRDSDGVRHSAKMVWRALAILQLELEAEGAPIARGAKIEEAK